MHVETPALQEGNHRAGSEVVASTCLPAAGFRAIYVEYASSGRAAVQHLRLSADDWVKPYLVAVTPRASKDERWCMAASACYRGRLVARLHRGAPPRTFQQEVFNVPQVTDRDQADVLRRASLR